MRLVTQVLALMMHEIPSLSLPYDFLNRYPHLPDIMILRGKGLPDICSEEWIAIVLYFDSGKAKRGDRSIIVLYLQNILRPAKVVSIAD